MHIARRGDRWTGCVDVGRDANGKRKQRWASGKTKKEVQEKLLEIQHQFNAGMYMDETTVTLGEYLKRWLKEYAQHNVAETTYASYVDGVKNLTEHLGNIKLCQLKPHHIQTFLSALLDYNKLSNTTIRYYYTVLNIALNTAIKWQLIQHNPCKGVTPPQKAKPKMQVLTEEQVNILLDGAQYTPMYLPVLLAVSCGMRRGEILGLTWDDIDLENRTIHISKNLVMADGKAIIRQPKTNAGRRTISLPEVTAEALKHERKTQLKTRLEYQGYNLVCCWENGSFIRPDYITHKFVKIVKYLDLPKVSFHDLRHTHATLLLQKGVHPKIVQERLGHASISMTLDTYSHVMPSMQREAADKMDDIISCR